MSIEGEDTRLILLSAYGGPYEGSFIPMIRALCDRAPEHGFAPEAVFSPDSEGRPWLRALRDHDRFPIAVAPTGTRGELTDWLRERLERDRRPVVMHTHFTTYDLPALFAARGRAAAVLWHLHTPLYRGLRSTVRNAAKYGVLGRRVDAILASGAAPAEGLARVGAPKGRVQVAGSAVQADRFPLPSASDRAAARRALDVPDGATVLLHFGWDWDLKDGDLFLRTVQALDGTGGAPVETLGLTVGSARATEQALADVNRLGLTDRVRVLDPRDDVGALYAAGDIFVSSSRVEGEPFAVIEAILSGLPVVATDLPGHVDVCRGLASCRIVERSPTALAEAIEALAGRPPEVAEADRSKARAVVAERFDLEAWTERMFERYRATAPAGRD